MGRAFAAITAVLVGVVLTAAPLASAMRAHLEPEEIAPYTFSQYVTDFQRLYTAGSDEYAMREALFHARKGAVLAHNAAGFSWLRTINKYTDWTDAELKRLRGYRHVPSEADTGTGLTRTWQPPHIKDMPASADWEYLCTAVKDQGMCGSCYAHAATEQLESYVAKASSKLPVLSQQQGADCTKNPRDCGGTGGCEGGTTRLVLEGFAANGASNVWTYPYRSFWGTDYACVFNNTNAGPTGTPVVATMKGVFAVPGNNYSSTMSALASMGPLGVAVDAAAWPDYHSGVYDGCLANTTILDHAVQLVGYGVDEATGLPYWRVRNSWGADFGELGYIRILRHLDTATDPSPCGMDTQPDQGSGCNGGPSEIRVCGSCGILTSPVFPEGASPA